MESARRRVLRRRPLTDCRNIVRKSEKSRSVGIGFQAEEVSLGADNGRRKLKSLVEANVGLGNDKENVGQESGNEEERVDVEFESSLLSTPPVKKLKSIFASYSVSPMTIYSRRKASMNSYGSSSCPPAGKKRGESSNDDDLSTSKWHAEPSKKKRTPNDLISQDFIERQRAYFQEIDKLQLPEEEVSESE